MAWLDYRRQMEAARGYLELGMAQDALEAVDTIPPDDRLTREALLLRLDIFRALGATDQVRIMEIMLSALDE